MPEPSETQRRSLEEREMPGGMLEYYISRLRPALDGLPILEKDAIVKEVQEHIREQAQTGNVITTEGLAKALRGFGEPEAVAAKYKARAWLVRASTSWSPWVMLRASTSWAKVGRKGIRASLIVFLGYGAALLCFVCASLKGFLSGRFEPDVGRAVELITGSPAPDNSRVIGFLVSWLPLLGVALGAIFLTATIAIVRSLIRRLAGPGN